MGLFSHSLPIDHARVTAAIGRAEQTTSGEIRVVIANGKTANPLAAAQEQFARLGMHQTEFHNGVLIFVAPRSRNFAVIGDSGVHEKCGEAFWTALAGAMSGFFQAGDFTAGLVHGIERAGALLAEHFPRLAGDRNELPNDIEEV